MGKYKLLGKWLADIKEDCITLSFEELEKILRFRLPPSSRTYRAWWANDKTHAQAADGWLRSGWKVDSVDLQKGIVTFKRRASNFERVFQQLLSSPPVPIERKNLPGRDLGTQKLEEVINRKEPVITGGVYRIFEKDTNKTIYVGETVDFRQEIYHNILMGNHILKKRLIERHGSEENAKQYLKNKCLVQYILIPDETRRKELEKYAKERLKPLYQSHLNRH
jgi:hypothetical protein